MRIGLITGEYPPAIGGVGDHTARLAGELARAGHQVEVLTSESPEGDDDTNVRIMGAIRRWDWRILRQIPRLARNRGWDVAHIQYQPAMYGLHGAINFLPSFIRGPAVVTTFHDLRYPYLFPKAGPLRTLAVRALARGSDAVIAVSEDDLPKLDAWRAGRLVRHIPLGDQLDAPRPDGYARAAWRARLGILEDAPLVAFMGLMNRSKGVLDLVAAVARVPDAHALFIGEALGASDPTNAAYLDEVRHEVERRGLSERVHWTGFVDPPDLLAWLDTADVVALPFTDGATLRRTSLITAWSHHGVVVTTRPQGAPPWHVSSPGSDAALYIPPGDPRALAEAIESVRASESLRAKLRLSSARFAERFSWPSVVSQTVALYQAALDQAR